MYKLLRLKAPSTTQTNDSSSVMWPPISPVSPISPTAESILPKFEPYFIKNTLQNKGYTNFKRVSEALQGPIFEALRQDSMNKYIIKVTNKSLHKKHVTRVHDNEVKIEENIIKEAAILKYLTTNNPPPSLAKYVRFFDDDNNYFLVTQYGGHNLLDFVRDCHNYIQHGLLEISEWISFCKKAMAQMVNVIGWMHSVNSCCHLDISLENFVIDKVHVYLANDGKTIDSFDTDFQIKIIDFGLAEVFTAKNKFGLTDFSCTKYVGKTGYKSPEVLSKNQIFDARSADCWSLGVSFFMMLIGAPPFQIASPEDITFSLITKGQIMDVLYAWDKVHFITSNMLDLLRRIFVTAKYRLDIKGIQRHPALL